MAGDWIKMRAGLLTNPKVIRMSRFLAENRYFMDWFTRGTNKDCDDSVYELCDVTVVTRVTVGSLLSVWASVNECADQDGFLKGISLFELDEMAGVPGFGKAMELVSWVEENDDGLFFPNFSEHNTVGKERSSSAKTGAERTKEWRERKKQEAVTSDVTVTSRRDHREEKRREEESITTPNGVVVASYAGNDLPAGVKPDCPHQQIIALYHEILPMCPQVRGWTPARAQQLRARWNEDPKRQNLEYWRAFFEYVKTCGFLVGQQPDPRRRPFFADLEWLTKAANFTKVREEKYE